jgi:hypothetical protein
MPFIPSPDAQGNFDPTINDFYVTCWNPLTGKSIYVRICMGNSEYGEPTLAYCHDLSSANTPYDGFDYAMTGEETGDGSSTWLYQNQATYNVANLSSQELAEFFASGSTLYILAKGDTDNFLPDDFIVDGNNIPIAREVIVTGNTERSKGLNGLFGE